MARFRLPRERTIAGTSCSHLVLAAVVLTSAMGWWRAEALADGAPRDAAAERKLVQALSYHRDHRFREAEALLLGTFNACEDRCSPP